MVFKRIPQAASDTTEAELPKTTTRAPKEGPMSYQQGFASSGPL